MWIVDGPGWLTNRTPPPIPNLVGRLPPIYMIFFAYCGVCCSNTPAILNPSIHRKTADAADVVAVIVHIPSEMLMPIFNLLSDHYHTIPLYSMALFSGYVYFWYKFVCVCVSIIHTLIYYCYACYCYSRLYPGRMVDDFDDGNGMMSAHNMSLSSLPFALSGYIFPFHHSLHVRRFRHFMRMCFFLVREPKLFFFFIIPNVLYIIAFNIPVVHTYNI